jgi:CRISPR/Cas system-associated exonuclease Cas4 (RecB family)
MSLSKLNATTVRTPEARQMKIKDLGDLLGQQYVKRAKPSGFTKKKSFAPSSFYEHGNGVCPRYWWHAFNGAEFEYESDPAKVAGMEYGTEAGKRIAALFETAGILKSSEEKAILENPPIFGYIDVIIDWHGEEVVGEVKTTKEGTWIHRATTMEPPTYNLIQLLLYMHIKKLHRGFLIYENKNTQQFVTIPVVMNEKNKKMVDDILEWMKTVYDAAWLPEPPQRPFTKNSKNCKSCPVRKTCWDESPDGKVLLPVLAVT